MTLPESPRPRLPSSGKAAAAPRFIVFSVLLLSCAPPAGQAQRPRMFGPYVEREISAIPAALFALPAEGSRREFGLLTTEPPALSVLKLARGDSIVVVRQVRLEMTARAVAFLEGSPARSASYALLADDGDTVHLLTVGRKTVDTRSIPLPGRADGILCADIDSDRSRDVLAYGRTIAGLSVLSSGPGPTLREPLFPELSAVDASVLDADGDGVNDIFLLDWLGDRLLYYRGIGGGSFSEPSGVDLPGEPGALAVLAHGGDLLVAVTVPSSRQILVFSPDVSDRLGVRTSCGTPWEPERVAIRDVTGDGRPDLISSGGGEVAVQVSAGKGSFHSPVRFQAAGGSSLWALEDVDGDRMTDLLLADPGRRTVGAAIRTAHSGRPGGTSYLIGARAADLLIAEAGGDGRPDIVVTSDGSLTVYAQLRSGLFDPLTSVEIPSGAKRTLAAGARSRLVLAFPGTEELGVVVFQKEPVLAARFPAGADPWVLATGKDPSTGRAWILSRYRSSGGNGYSLSAYEQVNERQYLERRVGLIVDARISAVAARSPVNGSTQEMIVAARDPREDALSVFSYAIGSGGEPYGERLVASLRDTVGRLEWVAAEDLDRDGTLDVILGLLRPARRIAVLYGQERTANATDLVFVEGLAAGADERGFAARDADGDGFVDLLACGDGKRSVDVAYGTGRRSFAASRPVVRTGQILSFAAGPLTGVCDLVVAEARGTMTVFHSPFKRDR